MITVNWYLIGYIGSTPRLLGFIKCPPKNQWDKATETHLSLEMDDARGRGYSRVHWGTRFQLEALGL